MIKSILNYFYERAKRKARIKAKTESVIQDYEKLINEFKEIQERPSRFSKKTKDRVNSRVQYLIRKGHIKVNQ